jgi:hypothetical protein
MADPCQKEQVLTALQVKQAEIAGDVTHIKGRIDNGMSTAIARIDSNFIALKPVIEQHAITIKRIEDIGWLISRYAIVGGLTAVTGVIYWAVSKGFKL